MFTPNRTRSSGLVGSRRSTPRISALKNTSRSSLIRRSLNPRASINLTNTSFSSPNVTALFSSLKHTIEPYETSIPVLVTEAIALAEDTSKISVKIGRSGWSWLVCDQKLFVWSHQPDLSRIPTCKELSLRRIDDDDSYSAELVAVNINEDTGVVSVVAVSISGQVMYWPNIVVSISTIHENKLQLVATQCFNVTSIHNSISLKQLSKHEGTLSRIGRRVSSFFFSSSSEEQNIIQVLVTPCKNHREYTITVLTGGYLRRWRCDFNKDKEVGAVQLVNEVDLNEVVAPKISIEIWKCIKPQLHLVPLDVRMTNTRGQVAVLVAISESTDMEAWVYYAVAVLPDLNNVEDFQVILFQHTDLYSSMINEDDYDYDLAVDDSSTKSLSHFLMWSKKRAILKSLATTSGEYMEEDVPFDGAGDCILSVGNSSGRLLLFSALYGLVTSSSGLEQTLPSMLSESVMEASLLSPSAGHTSLPGTPAFNQSRISQLGSSDDSAQKLQAAFLHYCKLNMDQAQSIIAEAFPPAITNETLDNAAAALSGELLDDYPAQDPRWAESVPRDITAEAAGSFILLHQLEDKLKAHSLFIKFLMDTDLWDSLSISGSGRDKVVTRWLLREHTEKLHAAVSLLQNHSSHQTLVDEVIRKVLNHRDNISSRAGLTPRDYFYREITKIHEIFEYMLIEEDNSLTKRSLSPRERVTMVIGVNVIMESMLNSACRCRDSSDLLFVDHNGTHFEYTPWTVGVGRLSMRGNVLQQIKTTVERGIPEAEDMQQKSQLHQSLLSLIDLLLDGYEQQIASLSRDESSFARKGEVQTAYAGHRNQVLSSLLTIGLRDQAAQLAEKYLDFDILVQICDESNDDKRLQSYAEKFSQQDFSAFLFRWYLNRRDYKKLLNCSKFERQKLKLFLKGHPRLAWMEEIQSGDYFGAHSTLRYLASAEKESLSKKKNFLSLSKLAMVFSETKEEDLADTVEAINQEQLLIKYQESLPTSAPYPDDNKADKMPVYPVDKLIKIYIDDDNDDTNECDFMKAFELLSYLPLPDADDLESVDADEWRMRIWCRLILRDNWMDVDTTLDPMDACSHTMLFKTAALAISSGLFEEIFPNVESLLARDELVDLCKGSSFRYLVKASFEAMRRSMEASSRT